MKSKFSLLVFCIIVIVAGLVVFQYYPYIFSKTVQGEVIGVERITQPAAIINNSAAGPTDAQMFSFAIAIKDQKSSEIFTGSSEDRQWAVVQKGQCAVAKFYPYPFWSLDKAGTYFGTRLVQLFDCAQLPK